MQWADLDITIEGLKQHYANNDFSPRQLCEYLISKSKNFNDKNIWIRQLAISELNPYLKALEERPSSHLPLYGIPFAIKDNIDLANIPTTAACEAYSYTPSRHAFVVQQLIEAGAIPLGKTNMDQFATGLVGTRSPWGACKNSFHDDYISGGSSAGSAVAVALGLASFSLGTDTAGSGRVPAAFNNIVGLKPTKGLLSTKGVVPACRSLDVVSIFSLTAQDARTIFNIAAEDDKDDPYGRKNIYNNSPRISGNGSSPFTLGIPHTAQLDFFGDELIKNDFKNAVEAWKTLGADIIEIDFSPFLEAAKLLYEGPWVTERYIATKSVIKNTPHDMDAVVRDIIEGGSAPSAEDAFQAQYKLQSFKRKADLEFDKVDALITPTTGTNFTIKEINEEPVKRNSQLGLYTNYMNLLDYSAIALPYAQYSSPIPNGFTLVGKSFDDQSLLAYATTWQNAFTQSLGNTSQRYSKIEASQIPNPRFTNVVVCGAHLEGQPLNWQLAERGASLIKKTFSSENYKLFALSDGRRPGMVRDSSNGERIEVEIWKVPSDNFGSFVAGIPAPLGIGKVELEDGSWESGFICDAYGLEGATDISKFGGWRHYLAAK